MMRPTPTGGVAVIAALALLACGRGPEAAPAEPARKLVEVDSANMADCTVPADEYQPRSAHQGPAPQLPPSPELPAMPLRVRGAYTVWGATHHLKSRAHHDEITSHPITVVGHVVKTNYATAAY